MNIKEKTLEISNKVKNFHLPKPKRRLSDKQRKITLLVIKIIAVIAFAVFYGMLWYKGFWKVNNSAYWRRIIKVTLLFVIPSALLFIKIKIPEKLNIALSVILTAGLIYYNCYMLSSAFGYQWRELDPLIKDLNMYIVFIIFIVLFAIFNSFKVGIIGMTISTVALGLTNYFIIMFRGTGFLASDILSIETAANVASGYEYTLNFDMFYFVMKALAICFIIVKLGKNTWTIRWKRILVIILAIAVLWQGDRTFLKTEALDKTLKIKYFKAQETFENRGLYLTFVHSIKDLIVKPPSGYSVKAVKEIEKTYSSDKAGSKTSTTSTSSTTAKVTKKNPNIIMIMNEAFTDFSSFSDLKVNQDCLPFYHSLNKNTVKGQLFVSIFGGGTSVTEFEALSSNAQAFIPVGVNAYTAYVNSPTSSMASILKDDNYGGIVAFHPFKGNGYKRSKVYPLFGFNQFLCQENLDITKLDQVRNHVSDEGDVDEIITQYEKYKSGSNTNPFFMWNVTMQNHSPFDTDYSNFKQTIKNEYGINAPQADRYLSLLKYSDDGLKKLVEYFKKVKEPTLVIMFGDHQPKIEESFYKKIEEGYNLPEVYKNFIKHNTQFVIWANYDIKEQKDVYISPNYMSNLIADITGREKTGYEKLVSAVQKQIPILTRSGYIDKNGVYYDFNSTKSPYLSLLSKYNIAQYNNLFDASNKVESFFNLKK